MMKPKMITIMYEDMSVKTFTPKEFLILQRSEIEDEIAVVASCSLSFIKDIIVNDVLEQAFVSHIKRSE